MEKYKKTPEGEVQKKGGNINRPAYKKMPYADERAVKFALTQMAKKLPEAAKLKAEDFIDNSVLSELEKRGFVDQLYAEPGRKKGGKMRSKIKQLAVINDHYALVTPL